jgi:ribosomal protein S18 acetylase RimI-like enzyme
MLLATLEDLARRGVHRATISTHLENSDNSVSLYESLGYRIAETRPRFRKPLSPQLRVQPPESNGY